MNSIKPIAEKILSFLSDYTIVLSILMVVCLLAMAAIIVVATVKGIIRAFEAKNEKIDKEETKKIDFATIKNDEKGTILRQMVAPDAIDPAPNSYLRLIEGGREVYVRSFTITKLPSRTKFANTFAELFDYPDCTSSVFVEPINEEEMSKKLNKHITVVDSELVGASSPNRRRQLESQYHEAMGWAHEIETGDNKFFNVGFIFSIFDSSVQNLNNSSDNFRSLAVKKGMEISSGFALQAEMYMLNGPLNRSQTLKGNVSGIKYFMMDKYSVSTIYNYTSVNFSHKKGIPFGLDMLTGKPVIYDIYNHKSFCGIIYGPMGYGKSATIKIIAARASISGYRYAAVDSQPLKGLGMGEFSPLAKQLGGIVFQLSSDSEEVLNLFDVSANKKLVEKEKTRYEIDDLDLDSKINLVEDNILTIVQKTKEINDAEKYVRIGKIINDVCQTIYGEKGIKQSVPKSLYDESGNLKQMPTLTDFYKVVLKKAAINEDETLVSLYNLLIDGLADYVKPIFYSKQTLQFFSEEDYEKIPVNPAGQRFVTYMDGRMEEIVAVKGTNTYFDGQSTISSEEKAPFINIDISQLPEGPKKVVARQIAISWINECVINKNSEDIRSADKLLVIFDECHENFEYEYGRKAIEKIFRTARKRNVAMLLSTQTISEFDVYPETQRIRDLASFHFIFAQPDSEKEVLKNTFSLTESQINKVTNWIGGVGIRENEGDDKVSHQGEMCIYDKETKKCAFVAMEYWPEVEGPVTETNAAKLEALYRS